MAPSIQIRVYRIKPGKMRESLDGWTRGVVPLRRKHGFRILGAWVSEPGDKFVWILSYDGPQGFEAADAAYYATEDRKVLDPDPAVHVAHGEKWFVLEVPLESA